MTGFFLVCLVSLLALPGMVVWYAGLELLTPILWRLRLLGQASRPSPHLLPASNTAGIRPDRSAATQDLVDEVTATRRGWFTRDYHIQKNTFDVYVRTQARAVDDSGSGVGIPYTLEELSGTHSVVAMWIVVKLAGRIPRGLTFHVEVAYEERALGDEGLIAALLDGHTRSILRHGDRLYLSDECLTLESPFLLRERTPIPVIEGMVRVAHRLSQAAQSRAMAPEIPKLLLENLSSDPMELVRARAADLLLSRYPDYRDAAAAALRDPALSVQFAAARHLTECGFSVLEAIIFEPAGGDLNSEGLRQRALRFMLRKYSPERTFPILERAIREGSDGLRQIAIRQVGRLRHRPAVGWLTPLSRSRDQETITAGCETLAQLPGPAAEAILIELLQRPEPPVLRAAIDAVAQIGTLSSSGALSHLVTHGPSRVLRTSAATTLQLVRTRALPEGAGSLSLLDAGRAPGALSVLANESYSVNKVGG